MVLRRLLKVTAALLALGLVGALAAFLWWRGQGRPQREGQALVPSLGTAVRVRFDDAGIPHVRAASVTDLARAIGWLHANERMGQMELQRRYAAGRLAEVVGERGLRADRAMRELGLARAAAAQLRACAPRSREVLEAYAQGVNAWLDTRRGDLPPDLVLLGIEPEPWRPVDSLGIQLLMAQMLSFSEGRERLRLRWLGALGPERLRELVGLPDLALAPELPELARSLDERAAAPQAGADVPQNGSNNWAVAASRSASGSALVANDPHLGIGLPSVWYQALLRSPEYDASGFTLPGLPMVVIGQGARVAWGFTNAELDVCDLFVERLSDDGRSVERDGEWLAITSEFETIGVKDGEPVDFEYRATDIGPLLASGERQPVASYSLAWTAFVPFDPLEPFLALPSARAAHEVPAIAGRFVCPPQNLVCGDADGSIVYSVLGRSVSRGFGDGHLPLPAWKRDYHWRGLAPHEQTPSAIDPEQALLVTANDDPRPVAFPHPYPVDAAAPQRAARIRERLVDRHDWTPALLGVVQTDATSLFARDVVALLPEPALGGDAHRAWSALRSWNAEMALRGASALYALVERELVAGIFLDELRPSGGIGHPERARALLDVLAGRIDARWFDDAGTPPVETRDERIAAILAQAWRTGAERWGEDVARWNYGEMHTWTPSHSLGTVPVLGRFFSGESHGVPGSDTTPCVFTGRWNGERIEVGHGASLRLVADCVDPDRSLAILPGGQSGHPFDAHYTDQIAAYLAGELRPMRWSEASIDAATVSTLDLVPQP